MVVPEEGEEGNVRRMYYYLNQIMSPRFMMTMTIICGTKSIYNANRHNELNNTEPKHHHNAKYRQSS